MVGAEMTQAEGWRGGRFDLANDALGEEAADELYWRFLGIFWPPPGDGRW